MIELGHKFSISLNVLPTHPASVAKGITILFDKSYLAFELNLVFSFKFPVFAVLYFIYLLLP